MVVGEQKINEVHTQYNFAIMCVGVWTNLDESDDESWTSRRVHASETLPSALIFVVIFHTFPAYLSFKAIESPSPHDDV